MWRKGESAVADLFQSKEESRGREGKERDWGAWGGGAVKICDVRQFSLSVFSLSDLRCVSFIIEMFVYVVVLYELFSNSLLFIWKLIWQDQWLLHFDEQETARKKMPGKSATTHKYGNMVSFNIIKPKKSAVICFKLSCGGEKGKKWANHDFWMTLMPPPPRRRPWSKYFYPHIRKWPINNRQQQQKNSISPVICMQLSCGGE